MNVVISELPSLDKFREKYPLNEFKPLAYYDEHLDCIRVVVRDCSVTEWRLTDTLTVLEDNYPTEKQSHFVGFTIKGVKHLFESLDLPLEGALRVTEMLNKIVLILKKQKNIKLGILIRLIKMECL